MSLSDETANGQTQRLPKGTEKPEHQQRLEQKSERLGR